MTGALTARALARAEGRVTARAATLTGAATAAFPDTDFVAGVFDQLIYLELHQAVTHSLPMMPIWAWLFALVASRMAGRGSTAFDFLPFTVIALAVHVFADICNIWGLALWWPFDSTRYALDAIFVIDPVYTVLVAGGLALSVAWSRRIGAAVGIVAVAAYTVFAFSVDAHADRVASGFGPSARQYAVPMTLAQRRVLVPTETSWRYTYLDLGIDDPRPVDDGWFARYMSEFRPADSLVWREALHPDHAGAFVTEAWAQPGLARFRRFVESPYVHAVEAERGTVCAWFSDLRFTLPAVEQPFVWGACRGPGGAWSIEQRGRW